MRSAKGSGAAADYPPDMDLGLFIAASGMVAEQTRQDQLSNDLANASTPGYKPDETPQHSFGEMLLANTEGGSAVGSVNQGVALGKTFTDMTPATIRETGEPLDFAIEGSGFFAVQTPQGVRYTRDGQFTASAAGLLTDAQGNPVLGQGGGQIKVAASGSVPVSALGVFEVPGAAKQGENLYTGAATGKSTSAVRQGALEASGVDAREGDGRDDHLAAQLPVRTAGDPDDRPDPAAGHHAGRLHPRLARGSAQAAGTRPFRAQVPRRAADHQDAGHPASNRAASRARGVAPNQHGTG